MPTNISCLPVEVLENIFLQFYDGLTRPLNEFEHKSEEVKDRSLLPLLCTCRQWQGLIEPLHYQRVLIGFGSPKWEYSRLRLISTLKAHPHLLSLIQDVSLDLVALENSDSYASPMDIESNTLTIIWLLNSVSSSVRAMSVRGWGMSDFDERLFHTIMSLPLHTLRLQLGGAKLALNFPPQSALGSTIKHLEIGDCWQYEKGYCSVPNDHLVEGKFALYTDRDAMRYLKTLTIWGQPLSTSGLSLLCEQPRALECLHLRASDQEQYGTITRDELQGLIDRQSKSLRIIEIWLYCDGFENDQNKVPDFKSCRRLETLKLPFWNLRRASPEQASHEIGRLTVRKLEISVSRRMHQFNETGYMATEIVYGIRVEQANFDQESMQWLVDLATFLKQYYPESCLQNIHIQFEAWHQKAYANIHKTSSGGIERIIPPWPWGCLVATKPRVEACGISFTWNLPLVDEAGWEAYVRGLVEMKKQNKQRRNRMMKEVRRSV